MVNEIAVKGDLKELAVELYDVGAIKYGDFVTKVGLKTPIYIDLRVIISYPKLMVRVSRQLWSLLDSSISENFSRRVCGVPYTALPLATIISAESDVPMVIRRKEAKAYGTKKLIEGEFKSGDEAVIVEDIITSGSSVLETRQDLVAAGMRSDLALIVVDREQGGRENLEKAGVKVKSLFKITQLMEYLFEAGKLSQQDVDVVKNYVKDVRTTGIKPAASDRLRLGFQARTNAAKNPVSRRLLSLMASKRTTICLAADLPSCRDVLDLADLVGPHIAALKLHVDILDDFNQDFVTSLKSLAAKHDFLLMEDRKLGDIGQVVSRQYRHGTFKIGEWADLVTAHGIPGPGLLDGIRDALKEAEVQGPRGVFLVAEMSSKGTLTSKEYAQGVVKMAEGNDLVAGFVCQSDAFGDPGCVQLTPGVSIGGGADKLGQQYNTPEAVVRNGADLVVVGRGITGAKDRLQTTIEYKRVLYDEYLARIA
ncbi:hypothetical protein QAD02_015750 [Eretmocerus hayati]|uniref:Uncharacterized protein n=1 Tax=Eretmocerus hayati TaxID=131215 RepID=A0ACC2PA59_9HYME|nr:hypothetical protein QAD02_015750 [Eretmocerus hayati]